MYDQDFWERVNVSQLCKFIRHGTEDVYPEEGTFEERYQKYSKAFNAGLHQFRDSVLKTDWNFIKNDTERDIKTEDMYDDLIHAQGNLSDLAFEVGMTIGFLFSQKLFQNIQSF